MSLAVEILLVALCFVVSIVVTGIVRLLPGFLPDVPNRRSSHKAIVPRGGGLGIGLPVIFAALILGLAGGIPQRPLIVFALCGLVLLGVGLADDALRLGVGLRLSVQVVVASAAVYYGLGDSVHLGGGWTIHGWMARLLQVFWLVAAINFFNFMDGIDALAGLQALCICLSLYLVVLVSELPAGRAGAAVFQPLLLCSGAAVAGFLLWNLPPASIFMGDGGSYFLGFGLAWFGLLLGSTPNEANPVSPGFAGAIAIWFLFVLDPVVTLVARLRRRENPFRAHREHLYQYLFIRGYKVAWLLLGLIAVNLVLLAAALWATIRPGPPGLVAPAAVMLLLTVVYALLRWRVTGRAAA